MTDFNGKTVVITGASRGLGAALAEEVRVRTHVGVARSSCAACR